MIRLAVEKITFADKNNEIVNIKAVIAVAHNAVAMGSLAYLTSGGPGNVARRPPFITFIIIF